MMVVSVPGRMLIAGDTDESVPLQLPSLQGHPILDPGITDLDVA